MFDPDGIVMTASKKNSKATMRLERKMRENIDLTKVHHVAGGPYKGILINKASDNLDMVEPAEGRLEFLAYLINQDHYSEPTQDQWTLKFWFRGRADGLTKKKTFTDYFQELMNPSNFPKNYIGFMKKALVLLRNYPLIKRVDLEVQEIHGICPEHDLPPIRSFVTVFTPNSYTYQFVPEVPMNNKSFLTFMIRAASDAHISLCAVYSDLQRKTLEIVIGGDENKVSMIREGSMGPIRAEAITLNILSRNEFRYFWLSWKEHHLEVGRGSLYGHGRFLHWHVPPNRQFNLNCLAVATGRASHGQWEFAELLDPEQDFGKDAKKRRVKLSLLWLAKKQRMLICLEDAYPNIMPVAELIRQCKIKQSDMMTTVVMLRDLQKRGLIREVETGHWMRMQVKENDATHEVKLVKDLPQLTGLDQPTIAIITALYCEKLAVDAMIEDKTTYVKYKTEGESHVYTLGQIGNKNVVSTKLSRAPNKSQAKMISAENTITQMLGTFSRIQHVLLVGVGGSVPHYTDYRHHVRLGDIVVSMPVNRSGSLYIHCSKMESIEGSETHSFITRGYSCRDTYLQRIVTRLRETVQNEPLASAPWDDYIEEGQEQLKGDESNYARPSIKKDKLFYTKPDGSVMQVEHPTPDIQEPFDYKTAQPHVRYGVIGSGNPLNSELTKMEFTNLNGVKCIDLSYNGVLDSLEGNRNNSFLLIRGISDYTDGEGVRKEWQPYASLLAAGYMKALVMAMQ